MNSLRRCLYNLSRFTLKPFAPPELLIFSLTECCNLKCITCSIRKEANEGSLEIDIGKIFDIVKQAKDMNIATIVLSGGEPFLVKEIFEIVDCIKRFKIKTAVTSNGSYGEQIAEKIAFSQIDHIHFSWDGLSAGNDEIRGKGSFDRLMRTASLIRQLNPDKSIGFGTVICSKNCNDLFEMTKIADDLRINSMNFIPFLVNNIDPQHSVKGRQYHRLWPDGKDLVNLERNFKMISGHQYNQLKIDLNPDFDLLLDYYSLKSIRRKCFAGYKSVIITAPRRHNGNMVSEVFFCQDSCGNIYNMPLKKAWNSLKATKMRLKARMCSNSCLQFCHYI